MMRDKDYRLEALRIISMFMVITIHVANYYCRNLPATESWSYLGATFFNALSRTSVPIFFMISGALMAGRKYDHEKNKDKVKHFVMVLIIWSAVYFYWKTIYMGENLSLFPTIIQSLFKPVSPHLWYMYPFIGLMIAMPFTSALVNNMDKNIEKLFLKMWMFFSGVVLIMRMGFDLFGFSTTINYNVPIVQGTYYLGYFIAGHILYKKINQDSMGRSNHLKFLGIYLSSITVMWLGTYYLSIRKQGYYDWIYTYRSIFVILATLSLFVIVAAIYKPDRKMTKKVLNNLSKASFGVYLVHIIPWEFLRTNLDVLSVNGFIGVPMFTGIVFVASYLIVSIIQKMPGLNKFI
jgi:surface polysaccharide O-acyltransferase-like enzyme